MRKTQYSFRAPLSLWVLDIGGINHVTCISNQFSININHTAISGVTLEDGYSATVMVHEQCLF